MANDLKFNMKQDPRRYGGEFDQAIRGALADVYSSDTATADKFIDNFNNRYNTHCDQSDAARASRGIGPAPFVPPAPKRCIVATELSKQELWTKSEYAELELWGKDVLDATWYGRAFHRGYPVVARYTFLPAVRKPNTLRARYFKWTFENAIALMRGKSFAVLSVPGSVFWVGLMFTVGLFKKS
jgi:hypothetical protein